MTRTSKAALAAALLAMLSACGGSDDDDPAGTPTGATPTATSVLLTQDFKQGIDGWSGGSSDYTTETAPENVVIELRDTSDVGPKIAGSKGYFISGTNRSDDLLLFVKKQVTGLVANTEYTYSIDSLNFLTDAPSGCMGVGGAPGESVWVITAATAAEPKAVTTNGDTRLNIDHGNQAAPGAASMVLGNIANGLPCDGTRKFASKLLRNNTGIKVKTDGEGKIWVTFGIDSGFEASSSIYLQNLTVRFVPVVATTT